MRALGKVGGATAVPLLSDVLTRDPEAGVRRVAQRWLAALPGDEARSAVEQAAATDADRTVRREARRLLKAWGPRPDQTAADAHDTH